MKTWWPALANRRWMNFCCWETVPYGLLNSIQQIRPSGNSTAESGQPRPWWSLSLCRTSPCFLHHSLNCCSMRYSWAIFLSRLSGTCDKACKNRFALVDDLVRGGFFESFSNCVARLSCRGTAPFQICSISFSVPHGFEPLGVDWETLSPIGNSLHNPLNIFD